MEAKQSMAMDLVVSSLLALVKAGLDDHASNGLNSKGSVGRRESLFTLPRSEEVHACYDMQLSRQICELVSMLQSTV